MSYRYEEIAKMVDHSILLPTATMQDVAAGCRQALAYDVACVCVTPSGLARCVDLLHASGVIPATTIGFPHGATTTAAKMAEAGGALACGAQELDMVVNIGAVLSGLWDGVRDEIQALCGLTHAAGARLKVIFENCYLDEPRKIRLCGICGELGVDWVKTSTGFGPAGAALEDVILMRKHSPAFVQVKAAGGVRSLDALLAFREAGATRIGTSSTAAILDECRRRLAMPPIG